jgi:hypothetical protein
MKIYIYNENCVRAGQVSFESSDDTTTYTDKDISFLKKLYFKKVKRPDGLFEVKKAKNALLAFGIEIRNIRNWFNQEV